MISMEAEGGVASMNTVTDPKSCFGCSQALYVGSGLFDCKMLMQALPSDGARPANCPLEASEAVQPSKADLEAALASGVKPVVVEKRFCGGCEERYYVGGGHFECKLVTEPLRADGTRAVSCPKTLAESTAA